MRLPREIPASQIVRRNDADGALVEEDRNSLCLTQVRLLTQFSIWILYQVGNSPTPYATLSHSQLLLMIDQDPFSSFFNLRRAKGDNSKITQYREGQNLGKVHHACDYFILFCCWRPIASSWNNRFWSQDISKHLDRLQSLSENLVKICK